MERKSEWGSWMSALIKAKTNASFLTKRDLTKDDKWVKYMDLGPSRKTLV